MLSQGNKVNKLCLKIQHLMYNDQYLSFIKCIDVFEVSSWYNYLVWYLPIKLQTSFNCSCLLTFQSQINLRPRPGCHCHNRWCAKHLQAHPFFLSLVFEWNFLFAKIHWEFDWCDIDLLVELCIGITSDSKGTMHNPIVVLPFGWAWCSVEATQIRRVW